MFDKPTSILLELFKLIEKTYFKIYNNVKVM